MNEQEYKHGFLLCKFCKWFKPEVDQASAELLGVHITGKCRRTNTDQKESNFCRKGIRRTQNV